MTHVLSPEDAYQTILEQAIRFVSLRPRSTKEIQDFIAKKIFARLSCKNEELQNRLMKRMEDLGYSDDEQFCQFWIHARSRKNIKGYEAIKYELRQKGVKNAVIEKVMLQEARDEDEVVKAVSVLEKYLRHHDVNDPMACRAKLYGVLKRRGFSMDTIKKSVENTLQTRYNTG